MGQTMANSPVPPIIIASVIGWPSFILYLMEVLILLTNWKQFKSSFYVLFLIRALPIRCNDGEFPNCNGKRVHTLNADVYGSPVGTFGRGNCIQTSTKEEAIAIGLGAARTSPYSPDAAATDYHINPSLKNFLKGEEFDDFDDLSIVDDSRI
uniref:Uncharacterized protein n=1 Tax=Ditylenchus dipsaci TaxID=166011 RepID=A0A915ES70_9BILA